MARKKNIKPTSPPQQPITGLPAKRESIPEPFQETFSRETFDWWYHTVVADGFDFHARQSYQVRLAMNSALESLGKVVHPSGEAFVKMGPDLVSTAETLFKAGSWIADPTRARRPNGLFYKSQGSNPELSREDGEEYELG